MRINYKKMVHDYYTDDKTSQYVHFMKTVLDYFLTISAFKTTVHSVKSRVKDENHIIDKLKRKREKVLADEPIYNIITDFIGVRVLLLFSHDIKIIHTNLMKHIKKDKEWSLHEAPKAYTWDPDMKIFFSKELNLKPVQKDSLYTSLHYLVKPQNQTSEIICEIQVRTLYEEIWGEVDHLINYPKKTKNVHCREQIQVLSRLTTTGTKLIDSIHKSHLLNK